ncbi:3-oxoacyl-ACP synthase III family protein [Saccharospirillum mangrovi]|uniref:3-oxoacyl-ACP synthase III family protein n=1 Tax=Saccharospirillum mangrovi TaxID=2161747 RepID=UPI0018E555C9|nr:3-oxoacyl-[acyl-carrier-protein] synthase III C-terminal domain-containing protein [Saccharospirillum mangrovi]
MAFVIRASAHYLPRTQLSAEQLDVRLGLPAGHCRQRYGVDVRHYAEADESALFMGAEAAQAALNEAGLTLADIDLLLSASGTNHQALPYNAAGLLHAMQSPAPLASFDVNATCLSFLAALDLADAWIARGRHRRVLIVSSEVAKVGVHDHDTEAATLFADGAAAFILEASDDNRGLITSHFQTHTQGYDYCQIRAGGSGLHPSRHGAEVTTAGSYFEMQGKALYRLVAQLAPDFIERGLAPSGLKLSDIDYYVPHQASHAGLANLTRQLNLDPAKVVNCFARYGNQIAASIPMALDHLRRHRPIEPGRTTALLFGSAAGLALGMGVVRL